jgi:xanthine dehydrogenase molybdopterin-binding subunit B
MSYEASGRLYGAAASTYKIKRIAHCVKSSQVNTLPKAKSKTRSKQNKDMRKCSSVYSERGVPLPVVTSGGE